VDFVAVVDQAIALRRQRGRLTYRTLQVQFQLALILDSGGLCSRLVRASQRILKAIDNERLYEGECDKRRGGRPRHIHAHGIQQEPHADVPGHRRGRPRAVAGTPRYNMREHFSAIVGYTVTVE
jgi:hypothetical protein